MFMRIQMPVKCCFSNGEQHYLYYRYKKVVIPGYCPPGRPNVPAYAWTVANIQSTCDAGAGLFEGSCAQTRALVLECIKTKAIETTPVPEGMDFSIPYCRVMVTLTAARANPVNRPAVTFRQGVKYRAWVVKKAMIPAFLESYGYYSVKVGSTQHNEPVTGSYALPISGYAPNGERFEALVSPDSSVQDVTADLSSLEVAKSLVAFLRPNGLSKYLKQVASSLADMRYMASKDGIPYESAVLNMPGTTWREAELMVIRGEVTAASPC